MNTWSSLRKENTDLSSQMCSPLTLTFIIPNFKICRDIYIYICAAKSLQSCSTLCDPIDGSPPGSPIPGILQARTLGWVAISFSNAGKWKVKVKSLSRVRLFVTPWTAAHQAPPSMWFSRREQWSRLPFPSPMHKSGKWKMKVKLLSHVQLLATPWTAAHQAPPSLGFSRQEYWSGGPTMYKTDK